MYAFMHHSVKILIKMDPPEDTVNHDLELLLNTNVASSYSIDLENLNIGQRLDFNATIESLGDF